MKRVGLWILMRFEKCGMEMAEEGGIDGLRGTGENPLCLSFGARIGRRMHTGWLTEA